MVTSKYFASEVMTWTAFHSVENAASSTVAAAATMPIVCWSCCYSGSLMVKHYL